MLMLMMLPLIDSLLLFATASAFAAFAISMPFSLRAPLMRRHVDAAMLTPCCCFDADYVAYYDMICHFRAAEALP